MTLQDKIKLSIENKEYSKISFLCNNYIKQFLEFFIFHKIRIEDGKYYFSDGTLIANNDSSMLEFFDKYHYKDSVSETDR